VIDCGEVGMRGRGGHGHNDILSFELFLNGINAVSDCGAYLYTASREWRNRFRSTAFHNSPQVDDEELNRFVSEDALWQLHDDAHPIDVQWEQRINGDYFRGGHDGYRRLTPPVAVRRELWLDRDRPRLVLRDSLEGSGDHRVTWRFHLGRGVSAQLVDGEYRLRDGDGDVWVLFADDTRKSVRLESGWVSPSYGVKTPTQVLVVEVTAALPQSLEVVFAETMLSKHDRQSALDALERRTASAVAAPA
jgi:uncharacterized heparinase superfamily protein